MEFVDTHTHMHDVGAFGDTAGSADAVDRAAARGVGLMILPGASLTDIAPMKALATVRPGNIRMTMGLHPTELTDDPEAALKVIADELATPGAPYVAVGEIGMDLYCDPGHAERQQRAFERQLHMASLHQLPVVIHCREALAQTLEVLQGWREPQPLTFHSFCGTSQELELILRQHPDAYIGINGIVTFKNSHLRDSLHLIRPDRLLLETDAPYLAPHPLRGTRNEAANIPLIASHIAQTLGKALEQVAAETTANAHRFFRIENNFKQ